MAVVTALSVVQASAQSHQAGSFYTGVEGGWTSLVSTKLSVGEHGLRENFDDSGFSGDWNYPDDLLLGVRAGYEMGSGH